MTERFIGKWHIIFYKNYERYILPSVIYVPKTLSCCSVLNFAWLRWRINILSNQKDKLINEHNCNMRISLKRIVESASESSFKENNITLRELTDWIDSFFHSIF